MLGKNKCKILKEIRRRIADENDIPYVTRECTHKGDCAGTCPRCEQELRYLEQQLAARRRLGKTVAVTALCAGLALTASGCVDTETTAGMLAEPEAPAADSVPESAPADPAGQESPASEGPIAAESLPGELPVEIELEGDVAWSDEDVGEIVGNDG